jgi:hypothetical protein
MASTATFRIRRVKCRDETGGSFREKFGNDEIKCAVFSADLRGSTKNSGRIDIYDDFDDGDVKTFNPPKEVVTLDLAGATGPVDLAFSVLLIESQLRSGDGLDKAFKAFVDAYEELLKQKLASIKMTRAQAQAVAQPGYLSPSRAAHASATDHRAKVFADAGGAMVGTLAVSHSAAATDTGTAGNDPKKPPTGDAKKVGDALKGAALGAVAIFVVQYAGVAIGKLIDWSKDKFFPPVEIKATIDASTPPGNVPPNAFGVAEFRGHDGIYEMEWDILVR